MRASITNTAWIPGIANLTTGAQAERTVGPSAATRTDTTGVFRLSLPTDRADYSFVHGTVSLLTIMRHREVLSMLTA